MNDGQRRRGELKLLVVRWRAHVVAVPAILGLSGSRRFWERNGQVILLHELLQEVLSHQQSARLGPERTATCLLHVHSEPHVWHFAKHTG